MNEAKLEKCKLIKLTLEIFASLATIAGISLITWQVFVARQALDIQARSLDVQTWQMITQKMDEIDKLFIEHSDLYPYFNQKKAGS